MKAIQIHDFGGPELLRLEEAPAPQAGAGQLVPRIEAAGVNLVDAYIRQKTYAHRPELPYMP